MKGGPKMLKKNVLVWTFEESPNYRPDNKFNFNW